MTLVRTLGLALWAAGTSACAVDLGDSNPRESRVGEADSPIIGGQATTGDPAVVLLVSYSPDHSIIDTCTAAIIAPDVVLTAAHCIDPFTHPSYTFGIFLGPDASAYTTVSQIAPQLVPVQATHMHPAYDYQPPFNADIGVAVLAQPVAVTPLPIFRTAPLAALVGQPARIVGYGQTVAGQINSVKHEATTILAAIDSGDTVTVGDTVKRSCVGDSGGPALVQLNGVETIIGEDSYTDVAGCVDAAHYRRTDLYMAFLDQYAPPAPPATSTTTGATPATTGSGHGATGSGGAGNASTSAGASGGALADPASSGCSVGTHTATDDGVALFALCSVGLVAAGARRRARRRLTVTS